jgi:hypothetical protein
MSTWSEPKYPGDTVRQTMLTRGDELGDVRIQHYGKSVRVASFLPGEYVHVLGDTPKVAPDAGEEWHPIEDKAKANFAFSQMVHIANLDGWLLYNPNVANPLQPQRRKPWNR